MNASVHPYADNGEHISSPMSHQLIADGYLFESTH